MFEFSGSLVEWLGLLLSLLTLIAGSGAGVYWAGVRSRQLDDRRKLLLELMPWFKGTFPVDLQRDDLDATRNRLMSTSIERIDEVNRMVRLLPWKDRALWHRVLTVAIASGPPDQLFKIAIRQFIGGTDLRAIEERHGRRTRPMPKDPEELTISPAAARFLGWSFDFASQGGPDEVLAFEAHLVRRVNPTPFARWQNFVTTLSCLRYGPQPWSVSIRPAEMEFYLQIRQTASSAKIAWDEQPICDSDETSRA